VPVASPDNSPKSAPSSIEEPVEGVADALPGGLGVVVRGYSAIRRSPRRSDEVPEGVYVSPSTFRGRGECTDRIDGDTVPNPPTPSPTSAAAPATIDFDS